MTKTRVDDMLIEMIEPKIREINEKFSKGEKLTQDDINTLLLKSQYNHINHLDDKLNETVEYVKNLENEFKRLEQKYEKDFENLRKDFENLKIDIEVTIQKSLNKNMIMLITIIGLFFTIIKIIDKF
jgi:ABC-type siderophore export system fused ATPase/permease subunit